MGACFEPLREFQNKVIPLRPEENFRSVVVKELQDVPP